MPGDAMRPLALLIALAVGFPAAAADYKVPPRKSRVEVYPGATAAELEALLDARGVTHERVEHKGGPTVIAVELGDYNAVLVVQDEGGRRAGDAYLAASFRFPGGSSAEIVNAWNAERRFCRAHVDAEGAAILEADLLLAPGLLPDAFGRHLDLFTENLAAFAEHVGFNAARAAAGG